MPTRRPRSMLFVSGEKVERFAKAMAAGADLVCIDLEDAVHPDRKAEARGQVLGWLKTASRPADGCGVALRLNGLRTLEGIRDVLALVESGVAVDWLLLPKTEHADRRAGDRIVVRRADRRDHGAGRDAARHREPRVDRARRRQARRADARRRRPLGRARRRSSTGTACLSARGRLVNAAKSAGLQAWDVPNVDLSSDEGLATETRKALALGFGCKTAIHPQQIKTIHAAFTPTQAEIEWATVLLQAVPEGQGSGAFLFQGKMVDAPLLKKARRIAELARASS